MSQDTSAALGGEAGSPVSSSSVALSTGAHDLHRGEAMTASMHPEQDPAQVQPDVQPPGQAPDTPSHSQQHPHAAAADPVNGARDAILGSTPDKPDPSSTAVAEEVSAQNHDSAPPSTITPQGTRDSLHSHSPALPSSTATATSDPETRAISAHSPGPASNDTEPAKTAIDGAADVKKKLRDRMRFSSNVAGASTLQRRRNYANTNSLTDYEADLTNKDRAKQKEAVKKYLTEQVKDDWKWEWPKPEQPSGKAAETNAEPPAELHTESPELGSVAPNAEDIEDLEKYEENWKERDEWLSNTSDEGDDVKPSYPGATASSHATPTPSSNKSNATPIELDGPDGVEDTIRSTQSERKRRRKKRLAEELAWNDGLRCFIARRDDWTGARKVRKLPSGFSPEKKSPVRASMSSEDGGSSTAIEQEEDDGFWDDDMVVPIAPPILPPENAMRASILPGAYNTIYDKVVVQALSPSCPINLKDVTRSCVQGWKRDGEWPPKSSVPDTQKKKSRRMSVASLLGFNDKEKEKLSPETGAKDPPKEPETKSSGSGIRNSFSKILHLKKRG